MHRVGLWPPEGAPAFARRILEAGLELEGLWTHFADSERDEAGTLEQLARFRATAEALAEARIATGVLHAANSGATIRFPQTHLEMVRPGAAVYGVDPGDGLAEPFGVRPALSWRTAVTMVKRLPAGERVSYGGRYALERDATIATVPVGYDDGYPRQLEGKADVLIGGRRHPVAGTITMDQILVDCGDASVAPGDEVVLIGAQGADYIPVEELAERAGTIARQITTGIGRRVPREYVSEEGRPR
jgi:alanine racemase